MIRTDNSLLLEHSLVFILPLSGFIGVHISSVKFSLVSLIKTGVYKEKIMTDYFCI